MESKTQTQSGVVRHTPGPVIQRLESGYWLVRWNPNQWIQWPCDRDATLRDSFGWVDEVMLARANEMAHVFAPAFQEVRA